MAGQATGVRVRHGQACRSRDGGRCNCQPTYEAWVFLKREKQKIRKSFNSLAAAKSWRADAIAAANRGKLAAPSRVTVREAAQAWLEGARAGTIPTRSGGRYKPAAIRGYDRALRLRVLPLLGDVRLTELRRADVQELVDRLTAEGLSASSVNNHLDPLRVLCRRAINRDVITVDPTDGLELRRPKGARDRIASGEEAAALLDALPEADRALWATALYAGLRRGELMELRWGDVDLPARVGPSSDPQELGRIYVARGWDNEAKEVIDVKSDAGRRTVCVIERLAPLLAAHRTATGRGAEDLVFGATADRRFTPSTVRSRALRAWEAAGLEPIGLHESRHTFASLSIAAGVNAKALSKMMGHATIGMTFDCYGHLMPGGEEEAGHRINAYLSRVDGNAPRLVAVS